MAAKYAHAHSPEISLIKLYKKNTITFTLFL